MALFCLHFLSKGLLVFRSVTGCNVSLHLPLSQRATLSNGFPQNNHKAPHQTRRFYTFSKSFHVRNACYARSERMDEGSLEDGSGKQTLTEKAEIGTRLSRLIASLWNSFTRKLVDTQKNAPKKLFSLLLGYYSANALSTLVGQTGDWDVFIIGLTVAFMEAISFLVYRLPVILSKFEEFFNMLNYWKIGLSLGLILDKFKLDSGMLDF